MSLKKWAVILGLIGFGMGSVFCTVISTFISTLSAGDGNLYVMSQAYLHRIGNPLIAFLLELFVSGVFVAIEMACTVVYSIESWSILKATLVHLGVCYAAMLPTAFFLGWLSPGNIKGCVIMLSMCLAGYFMIWLSFYISYKIELKKINDDLSALNDSE